MKRALIACVALVMPWSMVFGADPPQPFAGDRAQDFKLPPHDSKLARRIVGTDPRDSAGSSVGRLTYRLQFNSNLPRNGVVEVAGSKQRLTNGEVKTPVLVTTTWEASNATLNLRWIDQEVPGNPVRFTAYALHDLSAAKPDGK